MIERDHEGARDDLAEREAASPAQDDAHNDAGTRAEEDVRVQRRLRSGAGRGLLLGAIGALLASVVGAVVVLMRSSSPRSLEPTRPQAYSLDAKDESLARRAADKAVDRERSAHSAPDLSRAQNLVPEGGRVRNKFGLEGPAAALGIIGLGTLSSDIGAFGRGGGSPAPAAPRPSALEEKAARQLGDDEADEDERRPRSREAAKRGDKASLREEKRAEAKPADRLPSKPQAPTRTAATYHARPPATVMSSQPAQGAASPAQASDAQAWLARRSSLAGLRFQDPNGYFENSYVPGDPLMRALQARLTASERARILPASMQALQLDAAAQRNAQPFDAPVNTALSLYLAASERGISGERRMLLQVGLQATPRYGGRRPAMNVAIVLDLRGGLDPQVSAEVRALLAAFASARDLSDRFSLFAVGRGGSGAAVSADAFRNGPLNVALQNLLAAPDAPRASLAEALQQAITSVRGSDDPAAPLGSSEVVVVTAHTLGAELSELLARAHASAVDGVPLSAFGVGSAYGLQELSQLALAGQGNRRLLSSAAEASAAVDHELSSVARAVARAVRLRIRLAPGVRLVEVLGSKRLDEPEADQVRATENSIDQRLSRNLGITADRGDDEEGIQIVIPSFYAGDEHVILLDVVAAGPGAVADVSVRYKDLAQFGNGVARASLALPNFALARGALERNVLKNALAYELAQTLQRAGDALARGSAAEADHLLDETIALLAGVSQELPELKGDRELGSDEKLAREYRELVALLDRPEQRSFVADSLHFASLLTLQPRPDSEGRAP